MFYIVAFVAGIATARFVPGVLTGFDKAYQWALAAYEFAKQLASRL